VQPDSTVHDAIAAFQRGDIERARTLAEQQVATRPDPQIVHLLGLIECRSGRFEAGVEWLRRAHEQVPDNVAYRVMLARALVDSDRPYEALEVAQPPVGYSPVEIAVWHIRAEAADRAEAWEAAAEAWAVMCSARPADWRFWCNAAHALGQVGRWPDAAEALRRAIEANPAELPLRRALAAALSRAGRYQESADELGRWVEASPSDVGVRIMFARLLTDLGRGNQPRRPDQCRGDEGDVARRRRC
jgi:predicted Zn-dependent protease